MNRYKTLLAYINALALSVILLLTAIQSPTFNLSFYEREFDKNGTYEQIEIEKDDLLDVTAHLLAYMKGNRESLQIETKIDGQTRGFFSEIEISHMEDVEKLFELGFTTRNLCGLLFVFTLAFLLHNAEMKKSMFKSWRNTALAIIVVICFTAALVSINFDRAFEIFHLIFFDNDLWLLDPSVDLLINIVPTQFFIDIAVYIALLFIFFLAAMLASGITLGIYEKKRTLKKDLS